MKMWGKGRYADTYTESAAKEAIATWRARMKREALAVQEATLKLEIVEGRIRSSNPVNPLDVLEEYALRNKRHGAAVRFKQALDELQAFGEEP